MNLLVNTGINTKKSTIVPTSVYTEISGYAGEIAFEEFFIWWYHFIYTQATNILAERGKLIIPEGGNFYYK